MEVAEVGPGRLPELSFRRYLGILVHDIDDPHEIVKHVIEAIEAGLEKLEGEERALLTVMLYDGSWEIRVWVDPATREATIIHNISETGYQAEDIYKITIEEFTVTPTAIELHDEIAETMGLKPIKVPLDLLPAVLANILKIRLVEKAKEEKRVPEEHAPVEKPGQPALGSATLSTCLEKLWSICSTHDCGSIKDPLEQLERLGIVVLGEGREYTCIVKDIEGCPYIEIMFNGKEVRTRCIRSREEVASILGMLRSRGYEAAIA